ncbi:MAG: NAAT family transporter [Casimicrobiaceae bacterium]|nr:NAAT family transporter [Casimicrobiaceae bacterium]MCX8098594.1 NAAT family transporter [Casimicrobiaceae bacterium]MDW8312006.1 NAAT family transporter [Burkholderiales bacterium]
MEVAAYLKSFVGLLAIVDPVIAVPLFLALTPNLTTDERRRAARIAGISVFLILAGALLFGGPVLAFFGISLPSFKVAGAMLLLMTAISSFNAAPGRVRQTPEEEAEAQHKHAVAVVPIATPLLAGPGAISMVIVFGQSHPGIAQIGYAAHLAVMIVVIAAVALLTWLALRAAHRMARALGVTGMNIMTRVGGLITAALAIEILASGLAGLFPGLKA